MSVMMFRAVKVSTERVPRVLSLHLRLTWLHIKIADGMLCMLFA
jgi:hypothetical protein